MTRQGGVVEQIGALLDEGCAPDEIGVLLAMDEHEVRRIAQLLDERGPADPAPDVDVQAVAAEVETLPDVDGTPALYADDVRPLLGKVQGPAMARQALVTIADHVDHLDDVRDIASMLGLGPALDDWTPRASEPVENHDTHEPEQPPVVASYVVPAPLVEAFAEQDEQRAASTVLDHEVHSAAIVLPGPAPDPDEQPEHVHDVGPAWDEDGTPYALCATCGHRWDRQTCEVCGLNVTGLVIARTGAARHPHQHPEGLTMHHIDLTTLTLAKGGHETREDGTCLLEAVAWFAGEPHTDHPACTSPVLGTFGRSLNDVLPDGKRQQLVPFVRRMVGTAGDGLDEARSYLALDWLIRTYTPAWLDLAGLTVEAQALRDLRRIVDLAAAQAAGPVVREGAVKARAAWDAAWDAAGDAAWAAAWDAAGAAAWDAARKWQTARLMEYLHGVR